MAIIVKYIRNLARTTLRFKEAINRQRANIIARAFETYEGRQRLASAMVEPIRRSLDYQSVGRRLMMVDELPQGSYARYERDTPSPAIHISLLDRNLHISLLDRNFYRDTRYKRIIRETNSWIRVIKQ